MAPIFSRSTFRSSRAQAAWLLFSFLCCVVLIAWTKSGVGDFLGRFTDHLHHARATWAFVVHGLGAYREPLLLTSQGVGYQQGGLTWERFPVAYPPGMFVVFFLPSLAGRYIPMGEQLFGKLVILYLIGILHAALWALAHVFRRVESELWTGTLVLVWLFMCRITLLGFYDGAWLLAGALGVDQLVRKKHGPAVVCFLIAALISYRAVGFAVLGAWAFVGLIRSDVRPAYKASYTLGAALSCGVVGWAFLMLLRHSPHDQTGVTSALLPMSFVPWVLLAFGLGVGALLAGLVSMPLGLTVALGSGLAILHAGHQWHACLLIPALLALPLAKRTPLWAQILLVVWFLIFLRYAFWFEPFELVDEFLRFVEHNGTVPREFRAYP
jgi:hypothetical protein